MLDEMLDWFAPALNVGITMYAHKVILLWVGVLKIKMNSIYGFIKLYSNY